ncbi:MULTISPECIES: flagellar hook-basal body complex protein FliE [Thalassospira]|jgi:flagellar hook-basal body complex protein FliE|uniref:Flagellar hook-basal body complex protein FliE n=3 Tax=Thalassospira TaxID=168934 RepID=A0A358HWA3_9PROT|nr:MULTISPECIES: flagellar hook-basal body complex protein FliE [Thalassospira]MBV16737.1 flagellar hook-basal body complex protein FliE [Thalassospira sp.]PKR58259.1 flagellar hook-basal body complex protein FliE [Thalassospira lohafexi]RCK29317.1 flagellar hook-basal body protein FliE [Thalassospira lucentensis MCCC 1A00383 = DSM 14000]HBU99431.1 flagellar hook-basal body complex protein FliE [Thalassospira lucentensis]|tara:strand:- start:7427 stop:7753 length:327 start_codon:yes stop_codon:yes gene_type:complete
MVSSFNDAISAYRNAAAGKTDTVAERVTGTGNTVDPGESFADMVRGAAYDARDTMVNSEQMTQKAITGDAELHEVVTAVSAAEVTLRTVVGVRDKAVEAYQSILNMPV